MAGLSPLLEGGAVTCLGPYFHLLDNRGASDPPLRKITDWDTRLEVLG